MTLIHHLTIICVSPGISKGVTVSQLVSERKKRHLRPGELSTVETISLATTMTER